MAHDLQLVLGLALCFTAASALSVYTVWEVLDFLSDFDEECH